MDASSRWRDWVCSATPSDWASAEQVLTCISAVLSEDAASDAHLSGGYPLGFRVAGLLLPRRQLAEHPDHAVAWEELRRKLLILAGPPPTSPDRSEPQEGKAQGTRVVSPKDVRLVAALLVFRSVVESASEEVTGEEALDRFVAALAAAGSHDFSVSVSATTRVRIAAQRSRAGITLALRRLPRSVPPLGKLGFANDVVLRLQMLARRRGGLVICCGTVNSGKSTTLNSILLHGVTCESRKVVSNEDPVEYLQPQFGTARGFVQHREVGADIPSYSEGLRQVLRSDAEAVLVGEIRDRDGMRAALHAAQAGHQVYAALHAGSFLEALEIIRQFFPPEERESAMLALSRNLSVLIYQSLQPSKAYTSLLNEITRSAAYRGVIYHDDFAAVKLPVEAQRRLLYEFVEVGSTLRTCLRNYALDGPAKVSAQVMAEVEKHPNVPFLASLNAVDSVAPEVLARAREDYLSTLPGEFQKYLQRK